MARSFTLAFYAVGLLWVVFAADWLLPVPLTALGIRPRTPPGLVGVVLSPLLHANLFHLSANTVPLFVLLATTGAFYPRLVGRVVLLGVLGSGLLTWLLARPAIHVGASGLVYALAGFLMASGFFRRSFGALAVSAAVVMLYGGLAYGLLPLQPYVSWEGHLFGFLTGLWLAHRYRKG